MSQREQARPCGGVTGRGFSTFDNCYPPAAFASRRHRFSVQKKHRRHLDYVYQRIQLSLRGRIQ